MDWIKTIENELKSVEDILFISATEGLNSAISRSKEILERDGNIEDVVNIIHRTVNNHIHNKYESYPGEKWTRLEKFMQNIGYDEIECKEGGLCTYRCWSS